ncbi:hypothetical protein HHI36_014211 [Cryptolaemus montrouzieri]|uniref:HEAT repeat-containing protein 6 n=1 Tax=Cryptolaemus montrouzieri TaxID=559131 RepID=A0ABD2N2W0_9CUCU
MLSWHWMPCFEYIFDIATSNGPIIRLIEADISPEISRYSLQCLESCTKVKEQIDNRDQEKILPYFEKCGDIFLKYLLHTKNLTNIPELKIIIVCLRGLENIILQYAQYLLNKLGIILGVTKAYMLIGIKNYDFLEPQTLLPSTLSIPESPANGIREKKGGKISKLRKHRISKREESRKSEEWMKSPGSNYEPATSSLNASCENPTRIFPLSQLVTSDSDFSDTDINRDTTAFKLMARVRQMSLSLLLTAAKNTDRSTMFSFWSSFIPENSLSGKHYLTTCILEDSSPKGRTVALNVLLYLLTSSKLYLSQAESSHRSTSFTPYSVILGYMIIELHRYLSLALSEKVVPVLQQVLKCYAALVQTSPYHRLNSGLITKVVRSMRQFVQYKDPTIQVGALIVLGCTLASEPVVPETKDLFLKTRQKELDGSIEKETKNPSSEEDFRYAEFSSDEEETETGEKHKAIPWILERCLTNLGVKISDKNDSEQAPSNVKLESVQVIAAMCRNYFDCLVHPYLVQIGKALDDCLSDKYADLRLHAGRAIDFIGQSMEQYLNGLGVRGDEKVAPGLIFWQTLINGSLTSLLQSEQQATTKAVGCDCLGSIGSHIFERLPGDKQVLCVTLLFACSRDEENNVRGAALRALGISVLYPILREDAGFVADTAEAVYRSLKDENVAVRIKSSWALGNLSDALVINSSNEDLEELPNTLLLKILERSIVACNDNDKVKMNVVRAIGNLLQLITYDLIKNSKFKEVVELAISSLIKAATICPNMKVRWNSCYALSKVLKNEALYSCSSEWLSSTFKALNELVVNFRNFKVRINAALALSSPIKDSVMEVTITTLGYQC